MNTKQNEIKYVDNLTPKGKKWLYTKPFGSYNYKESASRLRDFSYIVELLSLDESKKISLLDLGCGSGWTSIMLAKLGLVVTGLDISKKMINIAKENAKKEKLKINFIVSDIEKINFKNQFDRVLSYDALHHCPNEIEVLKNAYKALKPGGIILIIEPNKEHTVDRQAQEIAKKYGILEKGYSPNYLKEKMKKIGFKNIIRYDYDKKPSPEGIISFLKQIRRLIMIRLLWSNYSFQVWLKAEK